MKPNPLEGWKYFRHLQQLRRFRAAEGILDAAEDWLDKEIADLEGELHSAYQIPSHSCS